MTDKLSDKGRALLNIFAEDMENGQKQYQKFLRWARRKGFSHQDAEDIISDFYLKVAIRAEDYWYEIHKGMKTKGPLNTWLSRKFGSKLNYERGRRRERLYSEWDSKDEDKGYFRNNIPNNRYIPPLKQLEEKETQEIVLDALQSLEGFYPSTVFMYFFTGMTSKQIGNFFGIGIKAVSYRIRQTEKRLRKNKELKALANSAA